MTLMTGGELLLKCLKEEGVSVLFGILDGSFNTFLTKLDEYEMRFFNPRHEAAAAHMAEAYARITGRPGVVIGGIGPGVGEGIAAAYTVRRIARDAKQNVLLTRVMLVGQAVSESTGIYSLIVSLLLLFVI